jgi:hypothetical protein
MPRPRIRKNTRGIWSEVVVAHNVEGCSSHRFKLATAAKEFALPRNNSARKAAKYGDDCNRSLVAFKGNSVLEFEKGKFREHILKVQCIGYGLT